MSVAQRLYSFNVAELGEYPELLSAVLSRLPANPKTGAIKPRYSKTQERAYVSNGCVRCDRIIGEFFEHCAWDDQEVVCTFPIRISESWKQAIEKNDGYESRWIVVVHHQSATPE